jgi:hypothetical protein
VTVVALETAAVWAIVVASVIAVIVLLPFLRVETVVTGNTIRNIAEGPLIETGPRRTGLEVALVEIL